MGSVADEQDANITPPRRGQVVALSVDATARAYDLTGLALGSANAPQVSPKREEVFVTLVSWGTTVWYHFSPTNDASIDDTAAIAAGSPLAFANTYGEPLGDGATVDLRIDRNVDKYLVVKAASGATGKLYIRPSSEAR